MTRYAPLEVDVTGWAIATLNDALTTDVANRTPDRLEGKVPFVRVVRNGGPDDGHLFDYATMTFECYAATQAVANQLAHTVRAGVTALLGVPSHGAVLTRCRKLGGPIEVNYANPGVFMSVLTMQMVVQTAF